MCIKLSVKLPHTEVAVTSLTKCHFPRSGCFDVEEATVQYFSALAYLCSWRGIHSRQRNRSVNQECSLQERGGVPLQQIFLSQNGILINVSYYQHSGKSAWSTATRS